MNPIRYMRYKTDQERLTGRYQDTGTRRREYEAEKRSEARRSVYSGKTYLGYTRVVETDHGTMHEALIPMGSYGHLSLGCYDTPEDAADAVTEWSEEV